jgi:hypothetical protein
MLNSYRRVIQRKLIRGRHLIVASISSMRSVRSAVPPRMSAIDEAELSTETLDSDSYSLRRPQTAPGGMPREASLRARDSTWSNRGQFRPHERDLTDSQSIVSDTLRDPPSITGTSTSSFVFRC